MNKYVLLLLMCFAFAKAYAAPAFQNYNQHKVEKGETLYSISNKYGVPEADLLQLNPDLKNGLKAGTMLLLPANSAMLTQAKIVEYKDYKVGRKETLYSIAQENGITVLDLKEANKELYTQELKKGDRIKVPVFMKSGSVVPALTTTSPAVIADTAGTHEVQPKETFYGISKQYGLTVKELEALNPDVKELQPGMRIRVKTAIKTVVPATDSKYTDYTVPPKMTMYTLEKMSGMSETALTALNPSLSDGLKSGMVLKLPNAAFKSIQTQMPVTKGILSYKPVKNDSLFKGKRIAMLLPFSLQQIDTTNTDLKRLKKDLAMRVATDFYSGALIARDSARALGMAVHFDVFDSQRNVTRIDTLFMANNFNNYDMIIGPLISKNVERVLARLTNKNVPVISPITSADVPMSTNLFQARPDEQLLRERLIACLKEYARGKHVIIIADNKNPKLKNEFKSLFPGATVMIPSTSNYIYKKDYMAALTTSGENIVILAATDGGLVDDAVVALSAKSREFNIRVFALENFDELFLPKSDLAAVGFTFPSINHYQGSNNDFYKSYKAKYGQHPNDYAVRGFDITMDAIMRLHEAPTFFESVKIRPKSMLVENPFSYEKSLEGKGYANKEFFILQYTGNQTLRKVN